MSVSRSLLTSVANEHRGLDVQELGFFLDVGQDLADLRHAGPTVDLGHDLGETGWI